MTRLRVIQLLWYYINGTHELDDSARPTIIRALERTPSALDGIMDEQTSWISYRIGHCIGAQVKYEEQSNEIT